MKTKQSQESKRTQYFALQNTICKYVNQKIYLIDIHKQNQLGCSKSKRRLIIQSKISR